MSEALLPGLGAGGSQIGHLRRALRRLLTRPVPLLCLAVIAAVTSMAALPRLWTGADPRDCDVTVARRPPSGDHVFGLSELGCDYYAMAVYGARPSLAVAALSTAGVFVVGVALGVLAGYRGGWLDAVVSRVADVFLGLPFLLGAIVLLVITRPRTIWPLVGVFIVLAWPPLMRITRAGVLGVRNLEFVTSARTIGASPARIVLRHVLPNAMASSIVVATILFGVFVSAEATLSYLGVGLRPPVISWGRMIFDAQDWFMSDPHLLLFSSGLLVATVLAFVLLGDALRDALDPRAGQR
jgi:peptide/nickel transport system permease protein/oligopeptide transport system permease protein